MLFNKEADRTFSQLSLQAISNWVIYCKVHAITNNCTQLGLVHLVDSLIFVCKEFRTIEI